MNIAAYSLLDLSAGIQTNDKRWRADIWGKNVTDAYYWTSVFYAADTTVRDAGMPATYGIALSYRY